MNPDRRQLLVMLAALTVSLPAIPGFLWATAAANDKDASPCINGSEEALDVFMELSHRLTSSSELDRETGQQILQQMNSEPWGPEHMQRVLDKIDAGGNKKDITEIFATFDDAELWFAGHLITTWVTGMYFHESRNMVISYDHALMFSAFRDIYPQPNHCNSEFAYWQVAPLQQ